MGEREVGDPVTDGSDATILETLKAELGCEGTPLNLVAPSVEAIKPGDRTWLAADEKLDDGPSALFDAVLVLPAAEGATMLSRHPASGSLRLRGRRELRFWPRELAAAKG